MSRAEAIRRKAEEAIAEAFNSYFANFSVRIDAGDVVNGALRRIAADGWLVTFRVDPEDAGMPSLELYATHRMTDDRHVRIWSDGHVEGLDAIREAYSYRPEVPGAEEAARAEYLHHNRAVAAELRGRALYPEGDINAYLRTRGHDKDEEEGEVR